VPSSAARRALLERLATVLLTLDSRGTARVGIDGVDGAGKTMLANELAAVLAPSGRPVIQASVDGFHHPRALRYRRGRDSPEGFFRESYDYTALAAALLDPLSPGGDGHFRRAIFDVDADRAVSAPIERAAPGSILLFDGIFLHRPELRAYWDFSIFLLVEWTRNHRAGAQGGANPDDPHQRRYAEGQALYFRECRPWGRASLVIDNHDLAAPFIVHQVERLEGPPGGRLDALVAESEAQGLRFVRRLGEEWTSGTNRFDRPGETLLVARQAGQIVGVCGLNVDPYAGAPRIGRVRHLYVRRSVRRLGVGRALLEEIVRAARGPFDHLRLRTANPAAAALYETLGFRRAADAADYSHVLELGR
jgi:uridine kinase